MTELRDHLQSTLGDAYAVRRELGGGGMSRVFLAQETSGFLEHVESIVEKPQQTIQLVV